MTLKIVFVVLRADGCHFLVCRLDTTIAGRMLELYTVFYLFVSQRDLRSKPVFWMFECGLLVTSLAGVIVKKTIALPYYQVP